jgi:hypothetical protein
MGSNSSAGLSDYEVAQRQRIAALVQASVQDLQDKREDNKMIQQKGPNYCAEMEAKCEADAERTRMAEKRKNAEEMCVMILKARTECVRRLHREICFNLICARDPIFIDFREKLFGALGTSFRSTTVHKVLAYIAIHPRHFLLPDLHRYTVSSVASVAGEVLVASTIQPNIPDGRTCSVGMYTICRRLVYGQFSYAFMGSSTTGPTHR